MLRDSSDYLFIEHEDKHTPYERQKKIHEWWEQTNCFLNNKTIDAIHSNSSAIPKTM